MDNMRKLSMDQNDKEEILSCIIVIILTVLMIISLFTGPPL